MGRYSMGGRRIRAASSDRMLTGNGPFSGDELGGQRVLGTA